MTLSDLLRRIRDRANPENRTAVHLAALSRRHGFAIGDHSYGRPKVRFPEAGRKLAIGRYCSIADRVEILLGGGHRTDWASTYPFAAFPRAWPGADAAGAAHHEARGDVVIGSDVWLGSQCMIMPGVTIGHGAVVAARAVVTRDVAPYAIVAGSPARPVRTRFPPDIVEALLETAWWDLADDQVAALVPLLQSDRVEELIAAVRGIRDGENRRHLPGS